ncbi:MAG: hypothetical protein SPJ97_06730 [Bacteroides sp.]|nr:hypothetical protein [Bacteroides sp.]
MNVFKNWRKSTVICLAFLVYITLTAAYLLPRNTELSNIEKWGTVLGSYGVVVLLWLVLRRKEAMRKRSEK